MISYGLILLTVALAVIISTEGRLCLKIYFCKSNLILYLLVVSTLKCWRCSSDTSIGAFCASDPINITLIADKYFHWTYIDCIKPEKYPDAIHFCRKVKEFSKPLNNLILFSNSPTN